MNITDAAHMARRLMNAHGLGHVPFEFDGGKRRLGCTHYLGGKVNKITLSRHFTAILPEDEIKDVILHEIAHALAPFGEHHGPAWKRMAIQVGAKPDRCATPSQTLDTHAWRGVCPNGHESKMHRAPRRVKACGKCCNGKFNQDYIFVWHFNGKRADLHQMPESFRTEFNRIMGKRIPSYSY